MARSTARAARTATAALLLIASLLVVTPGVGAQPAALFDGEVTVPGSFDFTVPSGGRVVSIGIADAEVPCCSGRIRVEDAGGNEVAVTSATGTRSTLTLLRLEAGDHTVHVDSSAAPAAARAQVVTPAAAELDTIIDVDMGPAPAMVQFEVPAGGAVVNLGYDGPEAPCCGNRFTVIDPTGQVVRIEGAASTRETVVGLVLDPGTHVAAVTATRADGPGRYQIVTPTVIDSATSTEVASVLMGPAPALIQLDIPAGGATVNIGYAGPEVPCCSNSFVVFDQAGGEVRRDSATSGRLTLADVSLAGGPHYATVSATAGDGPARYAVFPPGEPDPLDEPVQGDVVEIIKTDKALSNVDVALAIAAETPYDTGGRVIVSRDDAFADALASGVLQVGAPLLLVPTGGPIPDGMVQQLAELEPTQAVILGGPAAVSDQVEADLAELGMATERRAGASRFETAIQIAQTDAPAADTILVARAFAAEGAADASQGFADSIAAGALAAENGWPILLTQTAELTGVTRDYLLTARPARVLLLGGTAAVSQAVEDELTAAGFEVDRIAGATRAGTAVDIARAGGADSATDVARVVLVEGAGDDAWAGGFASASHAAAFDAPILLSVGGQLAPETRDFLADGIGGEGAAGPFLTCVVAPTVCDAAREAAGLPPA